VGKQKVAFSGTESRRFPPRGGGEGIRSTGPSVGDDLFLPDAFLVFKRAKLMNAFDGGNERVDDVVYSINLLSIACVVVQGFQCISIMYCSRWLYL